MAAKARAADYLCAQEAQSYASWYHLPAEQRSSATANVDVYLDDFISVSVKNASGTLLGNISKADLHMIHSPPPSCSHQKYRREGPNIHE